MKKFLSLVLALVMTMSLVTISAGATEFKDLGDVNSIEHKEAVELFNKIGIITGYEDGSFHPEKTLTREQAAKIIAIMALGNDAASKLGAEKAPFPDVPATSQFAGYIGYCVSAGIIDGYRDGTFKPKNTLTGYQFAKMLLGVVGYGVNDEYVGNNWALNVARDGATTGLFDKATVTAGLIDRDNATQIAFNALTMPLVAWSELLGTYSMYYFSLGSQTLLGTLAKNIFGLTETANKVDAYGYNTTAWRQNGKIITDYYVRDKILGTETDSSLTKNQIYNAYSWDETGTVEVIYNNKVATTLTPKTDLKGFADKYIQKGYTVNFVDVKEQLVKDGPWVFDGNVEKIVISAPALAEVTAVKAATSSANRSITLKVYDETGVLSVSGVETENFAKGDYILVTPDYKEVGATTATAAYKEPAAMTAAQSFDGKVSAFYNNSTTPAYKNDGSVTVDGTKYNYNFIFAGTYALGQDLSRSSTYTLNKGTYTFYLDNVGNVIGVKVKDDAVSDYAYIIAVGEDSFKNNNIVKVLTSEGKIATYTVSDKSATEAYEGKLSDAYGAGKGDWNQDTSTGPNKGDTHAQPGEIWSYSINSDNQIVLDKLTGSYSQVAYNDGKNGNITHVTSNDIAASSTASFTKGYSVITYGSGKVAYATDTTVFVYYDANGNVTTFTGKSNAPTMSSAKASIVVKNTDGTPYATFVVVNEKPVNSVGSNYFYVLTGNNPFGEGLDVNGNKVYYYKVIKDGAQVNIALDAKVVVGMPYKYGYTADKFAGDSANSVEAGVYNTDTMTSGTIGSTASADYKAGVQIGVSSNDNVIVTPNNDDQFVISADTKITDLTESPAVENASFKVGDTVTIVYKTVSGLQVADAVYITSHSGALTPSKTISNASDLKAERDGVYVLSAKPSDISGDIAGNIEDNLFFKYTAKTASTVVTLIIDNEATYKETFTPTDTAGHFFYVQVTGTIVGNAGTGTLKTTALPTGTHTYTIKDANGVLLMGGSFVIG